MRLFFFLAMLVFAAPASARSWGTYSEWEVLDDDSDYSCTLGREHEGPGATLMGLTIYVKDRSIAVFITNDNWTVKSGEELVIGMAFDGVDKVYTNGAIGLHSSGKRGFATLVEEDDFITNFANGTGIKFFKLNDKDEIVLIDYLNLDGTRAAVNALHSCAINQARRIGAAEAYRKRWQHIPTDPFSK